MAGSRAVSNALLAPCQAKSADGATEEVPTLMPGPDVNADGVARDVAAVGQVGEASRVARALEGDIICLFAIAE